MNRITKPSGSVISILISRVLHTPEIKSGKWYFDIQDLKKVDQFRQYQCFSTISYRQNHPEPHFAEKEGDTVKLFGQHGPAGIFHFDELRVLLERDSGE